MALGEITTELRSYIFVPVLRERDDFNNMYKPSRVYKQRLNERFGNVIRTTCEYEIRMLAFSLGRSYYKTYHIRTATKASPIRIVKCGDFICIYTFSGRD